MATKLAAALPLFPRAIEAHDVCAAFLRVARQRWGSQMPLEPARYARGVLTVRCPSPLWRTEVLYSTETIKEELAAELPQLSLRHVSAVLG